VPGILAYGAYVPAGRLDRKAIAATLAQPAGRGTRAVASHDEDSTTLGVEAARVALRRAPAATTPTTLLFSTATPTYADRTNATVLHAALDLDPACAAYDFVGSSRSALGAFRLASTAAAPTLVIAADIRTGLPGSADESAGGDAGAAFLFGDGPVLAEVVATGAATGEFFDRWRIPGERSSRLWEDRFAEDAYLPLATVAVETALKSAGLATEDLAAVVVTGLHERSRKAVAKRLGSATSAVADVVGNAGAAQAGLLLVDALDSLQAGQHVLVVSLADGADALVLRATAELERARTWSPLAETITVATRPVTYASFLTWRGMLDRDPPRRPDPEPPSPPVSRRHEQWKYGFIGGGCVACGSRHLPAMQTCMSCGSAEPMEPVRLADTLGTVATYTVDRLAFSLAPPVVAAVIDVDGGGRFQTELTDCDPEAVAIGDRVEMTFRRFFLTRNGIANYFWKARPVAGSVAEEER
jgi:3-hydroxy-3-methylglutaryl CoA synthase